MPQPPVKGQDPPSAGADIDVPLRTIFVPDVAFLPTYNSSLVKLILLGKVIVDVALLLVG